MSEKREALAANTVRFPKEIDEEIREFCEREKGIRFSTVLRECLVVGWQALKDESTRSR